MDLYLLQWKNTIQFLYLFLFNHLLTFIQHTKQHANEPPANAFLLMPDLLTFLNVVYYGEIPACIVKLKGKKSGSAGQGYLKQQEPGLNLRVINRMSTSSVVSLVLSQLDLCWEKCSSSLSLSLSLFSRYDCLLTSWPPLLSFSLKALAILICIQRVSSNSLAILVSVKSTLTAEVYVGIVPTLCSHAAGSDTTGLRLRRNAIRRPPVVA